MKISFHRSSMLSACRLASQAASSKVKPILRNLLLRCGHESELLATDTEIGIRVALRAIQCDSEGSVLIDPKMIEAMKLMVGDSASMEVKGDKVYLHGGSSRFDFCTEDHSKFPKLGNEPKGPWAKVTGADFDDLVEKTSFAADVTDVRYGATRGVLIELAEEVCFVGLDGNRLSRYVAPHAGEWGGAAKAVVQVQALRLAKSAMREGGSAMEICFTKESAIFRTGDVTVFSKQIAGTFPDYRRVIPKGQPFSCMMPAKDFLSVLRQAMVGTSELTKRVRFTFAEGKLEASIMGELVNVNAEMPVNMNGATFSAEFAPKYLEEMVSRVEGDVEFSGTDFKKPAALQSGNWLYLCYPMYETQNEKA